jgi:hypothetical protein
VFGHNNGWFPAFAPRAHPFTFVFPCRRGMSGLVVNTVMKEALKSDVAGSASPTAKRAVGASPRASWALAELRSFDKPAARVPAFGGSPLAANVRVEVVIELLVGFRCSRLLLLGSRTGRWLLFGGSQALCASCGGICMIVVLCLCRMVHFPCFQVKMVWKGAKKPPCLPLSSRT